MIDTSVTMGGHYNWHSNYRHAYSVK